MKHFLKSVFLVLLGILITINLSVINPLYSHTVIDHQESSLNVIDLIQKGKIYYDHGQFFEAIEVLQEAQINLREETLNQAQVLSWIALAQYQLGNMEESNNSINKSLELINNLTDINPQIQAQVYNTQAQLKYLQGNLTEALTIWEKAETFYSQANDLTGIIGSQINQTEVMQRLGYYHLTEKVLEKVTRNLAQQSDSILKIKGLLNIANLLEVTGKIESSQTILKRILCLVSTNKETETNLKCSELSELNYEQNVTFEGINTIFQSLNNTQILAKEESKIWLSLGNSQMSVFKELKNKDELLAKESSKEAIISYQNAQTLTTNNLIKAQAINYQLHLLIDYENFELMTELLTEIKALLPEINTKRDGIYAQIYLAENLMKLLEKETNQNLINSLKNDVVSLLETAIEKANLLKDIPTKSYGLGILGKWYEKEENWEQAEALTYASLSEAQQTNQFILVYQWQWQMARILHKKSANNLITDITDLDEDRSFSYYKMAFNTLKNLRKTFIISNANHQLSFREKIEPFYREYVNLLVSNQFPSQEHLEIARQAIEYLQVEEVKNHLKEDCLYVTEENQNIEENNDPKATFLNPKTAIIYPIILPEKLAIIDSIPNNNYQKCQRQQTENQDLKCYPRDYHLYLTKVTQIEVENTYQEIKRYLNPRSPQELLLESSQKLYNMMIKPLENDLINNQIKTLVFVLDGVLRNLPMSALYDGEKYLIEKYNIALVPGLKLLKSKSLSLIPENPNILIGGLSQARQGFTSLPSVENEIKEISQIGIETTSKTIIKNEDFTEEKLTKLIKESPFSMIHLATHGQFSSEAENTFILTWDQKLNLQQLQNSLAQRKVIKPIELLILSACQTASGDKNAALGLAGLAVRLGVQSTVATLWSVNDQSTSELMIKFYQELIEMQRNKVEALQKIDALITQGLSNEELANINFNQTLSQAEVLTNAQRFLLQQTQYKHPYYWSPFVLIGNWN